MWSMTQKSQKNSRLYRSGLSGRGGAPLPVRMTRTLEAAARINRPMLRSVQVTPCKTALSARSAPTIVKNTPGLPNRIRAKNGCDRRTNSANWNRPPAPNPAKSTDPMYFHADPPAAFQSCCRASVSGRSNNLAIQPHGAVRLPEWVKFLCAARRLLDS
jgi:hypothetical protein